MPSVHIKSLKLMLDANATLSSGNEYLGYKATMPQGVTLQERGPHHKNHHLQIDLVSCNYGCLLNRAVNLSSDPSRIQVAPIINTYPLLAHYTPRLGFLFKL